MYCKRQNFLILGVSKSGYAVAEYLVGQKATVRVYEDYDNDKIEKTIGQLKTIGVERLNKEQAEEWVVQADVIVLSPGVPINHPLAVMAKELNKRIIGELEFGFIQFTPTIIAVTGTNGKTTTVSIIDEILKSANISCKLVGNVGVPITSKLCELTPSDVCIAEVSSFQLETVNSFCPHVSCVLNIAPDHLERHYSMENYVYLKKRIYKNQRESEFTVLNYDDNVVRNFEQELRSKVVWVSTKEKVDGAYREEGKLYYKGEYVINQSSLKLQGEHNVYDTLFAIAVSKIMGVETQVINKALMEFKGIKHRLELVCEKNGIRYINDSKATNTASTISAVQTLKRPTVLILGGSEKGENYDLLFERIKLSCVKHVVLTGSSKFNMLESAGNVGYSEITLTKDFDVAVKVARLYANQGEDVLLSPACASFDAFGGYQERGERFIKDVEELID